MDLDEARAYVREHSHAVLSTLRRDPRAWLTSPSSRACCGAHCCAPDPTGRAEP